MRTIVDIPQQTLEEIDDLAKRGRISRAEVVRRAMAEYIGKQPRDRPDAGFGVWKSRKVDSRAYEDSLRAEWER